ncbi:MAG: endo-1,4-beta-xylanase [Ignavibacteriales bacterium]|nr:MAG: endo-1,4-beta-xylanase [Ignavibacteriales bacterium]
MRVSLKSFFKINFSALIVLILLMLSANASAQSDTIETNVPHLKDVFSDDFYIGCLLSYAHVGFPTDPYVPGQSNVVAANGGYLIKYHMNSMSPGNWMKPAYIVDITASANAYSSASNQQERDSIDIHPVITFNGNIIAQLNWAKRQGFTFRGHTLVWHSQTPGTAFFRSGYTAGGVRLTKEKMTQRMENFIKEVIRILHETWPGLLSAMDVVNEAIDDNSGNVRTTNNEWYTTFGDSTYIMKAFEFTRNYCNQYGETQMKLYYNDYNTHSSRKADGIVRLLTPIYQAGLLDGIGMQEHDDLYYPTATDWIASYNKFYPICDEMAVTELDVTTGSANPSASVLQLQANQYGQLFKCFVERSFFSGRGKIISVSKDGLNDQWTFKTNQASSLWNTLNKCKPAFFDVVDVGNYFNGLDSLYAYCDTLTEINYTPQSWSQLQAYLTAAVTVTNTNYTVNLSAADALEEAYTNLQDGIEGLQLITSVNDLADVPVSFTLEQNYPNPFNPETKINYSLAESGYISLKVYSLLGEEIAVLFEGYKQAGFYESIFNAASLPSGIYMYRLEAGSFTQTNKMILMK